MTDLQQRSNQMQAVILGLGAFITLGILSNYAIAKSSPWFLLLSIPVTYYIFVGSIIAIGKWLEKLEREGR